MSTAFALKVAEGAVLEILKWYRQRQADGQDPPTDEEVIARVREKILKGNAEGEAWERENPQS